MGLLLPPAMMGGSRQCVVLLILSFVAVGAFIAPTSETAMLDVGETVQLDAACSKDELAAGKTEDEQEGSMVCVACADSSDKTFNDAGTCVASCSSGKTANALRECECPDGTAIKSVNDTSCVDCNESTDFQYTNGGVCVASCQADKPPNSNGLCSCPDGKAAKSDTDSRCVPCVESIGNPFTFTNGCVDACPGGFESTDDTKVCACLKGTALKGGDTDDKDLCVACKDSSDSQFTNVDVCVDQCPAGMTSNNDDKVCECPSGQAVKDDDDSSCVPCAQTAEFPYNNVGECVVACPPSKPTDSQKVCVCPADTPYDNNNFCVNECPADKPSNNDNDKVCTEEDVLTLESLFA